VSRVATRTVEEEDEAEGIEETDIGPPPTEKLAIVGGKIRGPSKGKSDDKSRAQVNHGLALATIISRGGKDIKWKPGFDSMEAAQDWASHHVYSDTHRDETLRGRPIYYVRNDDVDGDGQKEVVIRRTKNDSIFMMDGYKLVPSRRTYRHGYDTLFPNKIARKEGKAAGITRKNYMDRALKYNAETGSYMEWKDVHGREADVHSKIKERMQSKRVSLTEAFNYFFFQLAWRAFGKGIVASKLISEVRWKRAVPKLLPLFGKAKNLALKAYVSYFGDFTQAEVNYFIKFENLNDSLHGRGALIDMVWIAFVNALFDGNPDIEKYLFEIFVQTIIAKYVEVANSAIKWIKDKEANIQSKIDRTYTPQEPEAEIKELRQCNVAIHEIAKIMIENNLEQLVNAGMSVELNDAHETLVPALQSRMQLNILNMEGIKGGVKTAKKPGVPAGETIKSVQKQIEATAGPKTIWKWSSDRKNRYKTA
jgi:hypothetical protein